MRGKIRDIAGPLLGRGLPLKPHFLGGLDGALPGPALSPTLRLLLFLLRVYADPAVSFLHSLLESPPRVSPRQSCQIRITSRALPPLLSIAGNPSPCRLAWCALPIQQTDTVLHPSPTRATLL
jgi:hypothetical protein